MKEDMRQLFGKEWQWFRRLSLLNKLRGFWFCMSLCLVGCVGEDVHPYVVVVLVLNFLASAASARRLPMDEYEG